MKAIDDAMIIAAVQKAERDETMTVVDALFQMSGLPIHDCNMARIDAETRGLIRYEVVEARTEVAAGANAIDREYDQQVEYLKGSVDGLNRLVGELSKDVSKHHETLCDLERRMLSLEAVAHYHGDDEAADPIHDEETELDGRTLLSSRPHRKRAGRMTDTTPTHIQQVRKPTGGPAFPVGDQHNIVPESGMSLRDYFACAAFQRAYIPITMFEGGQDHSQERLEEYAQSAAREAYRIADAMLAETEG